LNGLVSYVAETERAQEERRERRMSGDMEEEQGPMDVYKYSPAQVVDGKLILHPYHNQKERLMNRSPRTTTPKPIITTQNPCPNPQISKMSPRSFPTGFLP
jgi:hypothetical protein